MTAPLSIDELGDLDAVQIALMVNSREMSVSSAIVASLARAKHLGPSLGCIATLDRDVAIAHASRGERGGKFAGVPTLIKDTDNWIGLPTRMGSRAFPTARVTTQTPYMDAVAASGIIPIGKSAVPEFAMHVTTEPSGFGACVNLWNKDYSAGGSSGGAAVSVAARIVPIAHAGDAAGSIRIPAACCGVLGFKPSRGRTVDNGDDGGPAQVTSQGAIARSVRDLVTWMEVTQARRGSAAYPAFIPQSVTESRRLRVGVQVEGMNGCEPCPQTLAALMAMSKATAAAGHKVREDPINSQLSGNFRDAFALYWGFAAVSAVATISEQLGRPPNEQELEARTIKIAADFAAHVVDLPAAVGTLMSTWDTLSPAFDDIDVMISPVTSRPAPLLGSLDIEASGRDMVMHVLDYASYTPIQNASGQPAIAIPAGFTQEGLPIGIQLTARPGDDAFLFALAHELEWAGAFVVKKPDMTWANGARL